MTWDEFLTDYERKIASTEDALANGTDLDPEVLKPFVPPKDLGPIPDYCIPRTVDIIRRSADIGQRLEQAMSAIQHELGENAKHTTPKSPFKDSTTPKYFDSAV